MKTPRSCLKCQFEWHKVIVHRMKGQSISSRKGKLLKACKVHATRGKNGK